MASDSDLEAYLNQLSRKTNTLKKDGHALGYGSSRPSSVEDKSSDDLELSNENSLQGKKPNRKMGHMVMTSDITALSEKYSRQTVKSSTQDEFSNLEKKYLKKMQKKGASRKGSDLIERDGKKNQIHFHKGKASNSEKDESVDSLVDDELAQYLNESSITESDSEKTKGHIKPARSVLPSGQSSEDESYDGFNLDNILTVNDILGQLSVNEDDVHIKPEEKDINHSRTQSRMSYMSQQDVEESIVVDEKDPSHKSEDESPSESAGKVVRSLFRKPSTSCFYPDTEVEEEDRHVDKLEGVLFTEISHNVFHSSRRNSLMMTPVLNRKSSTKSLHSASIQDQAAIYDSEDSTDHSSAESIAEKISVACESSVPESVTEKNSQNIIGNYTEDFESTDNGKSSKREFGRPYVKAVKNSEYDDAERNADGKLSDTKRGEASHRNSTSSRDGKNQSGSESHTSSSDQKVRKSKKSHRNKDEHHLKYHKKSKKKNKKHRRRSPSSSQSSSTSSSSSSSSESDSESEWERHKKSRRRKKKHRKIPVNPWTENPYVSPWWWMRNQTSSYFGARASFYIPHHKSMKDNLLGVDDIMRQQVALTRQFMDSQQALYHAYTATLTSSYHYTSLKDTERYIKKKKQPLTFDEAYRLVKEEMKASRKKGSGKIKTKPNPGILS